MTINLQKIYLDYRDEETSARLLLEQQNWFCRIADFDPRTGLALPQALSAFLERVTLPTEGGVIFDRLWRITEHSRASIERLFHSLNESSRREQALMPVHAVRELDANSFIKLSNRPGRNIREKLAGKPYMQAVRRFQSVDLPENRLLKALVRHLVDLLELRHDCLSHEDELLHKIQLWLRSEQAQAIGNWNNLPPNNTLLSHRDYRRVWDAWRWLQILDDDIASDFAQLEARDKTMRLWTQCAQMWSAGTHLFAEMPLFFDYEKFEILPWSSKPPLLKTSRQIIQRRIHRGEITEPVCIDFTSLRPRYARVEGKAAQSLPETFVWQKWRRADNSVQIELFHSDAVWLHPQSTTISAPDLFFAKDNTSESYDRAALAFASHLRGIFRHDTLVWLTPDYLNDFELEVIRRNLNACFTDSEPLPRSVAAVFSQIDYSKIRDDFTVLVVDDAGGQTCATKLIAKFDMELKKCVPETRGFYWERWPSVIIAGTDHDKCDIDGYGIASVDANEQWHDPATAKRSKFVDASFLRGDPRIGNFAFCINLMESPVAGGVTLHTLQQRAGDVPIWRNHIPELSIKVMKNNTPQRFHLVSRGTTVKPSRGKPVSIKIDEDFTLISGKTFYQFPLYIGDNADDLGFSARLNSSAFPLKSDILCDLNLTFEYGADEPYKLVFAPRDKSFLPVRAKWQRTEEVIVTDAPWPEYPAPMTWADLRSFPDIKSGGTMNLMVKLDETSANLTRWTYRNEIDRIEKSIKGWCRFLVIQLWRNGRTASEELERAAENFKLSLSKILEFERRLTSDVRFLECCMHEDAPEDCIGWIFDQLEGDKILQKRAIGFALGNVSVEWQKDALSKLVDARTSDALRVFSYAIWRDESFVEQFSGPEFQGILERLSVMLSEIKQCPPEKNKWTVPNWIRAVTEPLELLLGLLRTRASSDLETRMLLQPHQKITKELAKQVERVTDIVLQSDVSLFSRVQINIDKPEGDRTPDLLYTLRLYLTGDDGANAIHISSISDGD